MPELGKIERVEDLRKIWPNEARDFTVWLAQNENLAMLGETVGIDIDLEERESPVGSFLLIFLPQKKEPAGRLSLKINWKIQIMTILAR